MRWLLVATASLAPFALRADDPPKAKPVDVPVDKRYDKFRLLGKLGVEFGKVVTVQGVMEESWMLRNNVMALRVQRTNGKATQEDIRLRVTPYFSQLTLGEKKLSEVKEGESFEFEGYEVGGFVGVPMDAYKRSGDQSASIPFQFHHELVAYEGKKIEPITWSPADFVDREAMLEGKAVSRDKKAYIDGDGWKLLTDSVAAWPKEMEGKTVEGFGTVKKMDGGQYKLEKGATRLVKLEDQVGRAVELRGTAWTGGNIWWFEYRGTYLYVEDMAKLPGWDKPFKHAQPVIITGTLDEAEMPDISQRNLKDVPDKKKYFIVRKAAWKSLDALLAPERVKVK